MRRSIRARPRSGYSRIYGFGAVLPIALARKFSGSRLAACRGWRAGGEPVIWALMVGKPASIMVLDRVRRVASRWTFWIARGASRCHGRFGSREARMTFWITKHAKANAKVAKTARRGQAVASKAARLGQPTSFAPRGDRYRREREQRGQARLERRFGSRGARMTFWIAKHAKANAKDAKDDGRGPRLSGGGLASRRAPGVGSRNTRPTLWIAIRPDNNRQGRSIEL
jgi:hypothetical protein